MKKWVDPQMELYKAESHVGKGSVVIAEIYLALWVSVSFSMGSHQVQLFLHRLRRHILFPIGQKFAWFCPNLVQYNTQCFTNSFM